MWPYGMTRQDLEAFLKEYYDVFLDVLLTTESYTVDSVVMNHMADQLREWEEAGEIEWRYA